MSAEQAKGKVELGSESRHCLPTCPAACCQRLSNPRFLVYAARHSQQIPDRVVDSIFKKTLGKYAANCKYSIVSVSDEHMVTCAGVGHLNFPDRFCPIGSQGFHEARPREWSPE